MSAPPVGPAATIAEVVQTLIKHKGDKKLSDQDWIIGYGYDKTSYQDGREAVKEDFDAAFPDNPIANNSITFSRIR